MDYHTWVSMRGVPPSWQGELVKTSAWLGTLFPCGGLLPWGPWWLALIKLVALHGSCMMILRHLGRLHVCLHVKPSSNLGATTAQLTSWVTAQAAYMQIR